jgi:hypothetical protein
MRGVVLCLSVMAALAPAAARASGNAHVIDDSEVEAFGHCHLEVWGSSFLSQGYFGTIAPACTLPGKTWLEVDGFASRYSPARGASSTTIGLGPKINLRVQERGLGIGLSGMVAYDVEHHRIGNATLNIPFSMPVKRWLRINVNVGAQWVKDVHGLAATGGVQAEYMPLHGPELMVEWFAHSGLPSGAQGGLRWTVDHGRTDLDVDYGRYVDGVSRNAVTLGVTVRR